jgi:hypothetical protein
MTYKSGAWGKEAKARSERRRAYFAAYQKQWRIDNFELWQLRHNARKKLGRAVKAGEIKRMPCIVCGDKKSQGHHPDYSKPLEVVWLCKRHHLRLHRGQKIAE